MNDMYVYLNSLKNSGYSPSRVLDIGANIGEFSCECKKIWPNAELFLVEANKNCEEHLKKTSHKYFIEVLGEKDGEEVEFYLTSENDICTGNSTYLEKTNHYSKEKLIIEKRITKKIDTLFKGCDFDLIKIDTQGSELDILKGCVETSKKTSYFLIETSIKEYNENAPLEPEIIDFMKSIGFDCFTEIGKHLWPIDGGLFKKGELFQRDLLFYRK